MVVELSEAEAAGVMDDLRKQVAAQHRAVAHMARALAELYESSVDMCERVADEDHLAFLGAETAALMETLGDILNGMDAVSEQDAWLGPIFAEAQRRWPQAAEAA